MFKIILAFSLLCNSALADSPPPAIQSVGAFTIYTSQDMKILADWYEKFGFDLQFKWGVYYGSFKNQKGPPYVGIHPSKASAPKKDSGNISLVFRVNDYVGYVALLEKQGLVPENVESDPKEGRFAHYRDPDGNEMTIWGD